jgi:hypothetical protein
VLASDDLWVSEEEEEEPWLGQRFRTCTAAIDVIKISCIIAMN